MFVVMNSLEKRIFNSSGFTHLEKKLTKIIKSKFDSVAFVSLLIVGSKVRSEGPKSQHLSKKQSQS